MRRFFILSAILCLCNLAQASSLSQSCVAWYKMNDNADSKVVIDSRGFSNGTAQQNTSALHTAGKVGGALTFNGTSDYVNTGNTFQSVFQDSFTISIWYKISGGLLSNIEELFGAENLIGSVACVIGNYSPTELTASYVITPNYNNQIIFTATDGTEKWTHLVFIVEQLTPSTVAATVYLNGLMVGQSSDAMLMSNFVDTPNLFIGASPGTAIGHWNGSLDDVQIFNRALTPQEVSRLYANGRGSEDLFYGQKQFYLRQSGASQ